MQEEDFLVTLGEMDDGRLVWLAVCEVCGDGFWHQEWEGRMIKPLESHVHLKDPQIEAMLEIHAPTDNILKALGIPEDML